MPHVTEIAVDYANDRVKYRVEIDGLRFIARITLSSKTGAKPSPEEKIKDWFTHRPFPAEGAVIDIPGWYFQGW